MAVSGTSALTMQSFAPGVHVFELRNVSIKACDVDFDVQTNLNLKEDKWVLDRQLDEFSSLCVTFDKEAFRGIFKHCITRSKALREEATAVMEGITASYSHRTKRSSALLKLGDVMVTKYAPHLLIGSSILYQAIENHQLAAEIKNVKTKTATITLSSHWTIRRRCPATQSSKIICATRCR